MKFTLGWLKEHLVTDASAQDVADTLNKIGLEVEGVDDPAEITRAIQNQPPAQGCTSRARPATPGMDRNPFCRSVLQTCRHVRHRPRRTVEQLTIT